MKKQLYTLTLILTLVCVSPKTLQAGSGWGPFLGGTATGFIMGRATAPRRQETVVIREQATNCSSSLRAAYEDAQYTIQQLEGENADLREELALERSKRRSITLEKQQLSTEVAELNKKIKQQDQRIRQLKNESHTLEVREQLIVTKEQKNTLKEQMLKEEAARLQEKEELLNKKEQRLNDKEF